MPREPQKHLRDMLDAAHHIVSFTEGIDKDRYAGDLMRKRAAEREFTILGEALNRLKRDNPEVVEQMQHVRAIRSFRNRLVHQYEAVDDTVVFGIIRRYVPLLMVEVQQILDSMPVEPDKPRESDL